METVKADKTRFPKLEDCAHFHYECTEIGPLKTVIIEDQLCPKSPRKCAKCERNGKNNPCSCVYSIEVTSHSKSWVVRRSLENFALLDEQLHKCIYDRRYSRLPEFNRLAVETGLRTGSEEQENVPPPASQTEASLIDNKVGTRIYSVLYKFGKIIQVASNIFINCNTELMLSL